MPENDGTLFLIEKDRTELWKAKELLMNKINGMKLQMQIL